MNTETGEAKVRASFARAYRLNMRHWAMLWREARQSDNPALASLALSNAALNNRWAKEAA